MKNDEIPDVTAFPVEHAFRLLEDHGVSYYVKKALPSRPLGKVRQNKNKEQQPPTYRVIRQIESKEGVIELVIAPEAAEI